MLTVLYDFTYEHQLPKHYDALQASWHNLYYPQFQFKFQFSSTSTENPIHHCQSRYIQDFTLTQAIEHQRISIENGFNVSSRHQPRPLMCNWFCFQREILLCLSDLSSRLYYVDLMIPSSRDWMVREKLFIVSTVAIVILFTQSIL